jgi:hypothetical protein
MPWRFVLDQVHNPLAHEYADLYSVVIPAAWQWFGGVGDGLVSTEARLRLASMPRLSWPPIRLPTDIPLLATQPRLAHSADRSSAWPRRMMFRMIRKSACARACARWLAALRVPLGHLLAALGVDASVADIVIAQLAVWFATMSDGDALA